MARITLPGLVLLGGSLSIWGLCGTTVSIQFYIGALIIGCSLVGTVWEIGRLRNRQRHDMPPPLVFGQEHAER